MIPLGRTRLIAIMASSVRPHMWDVKPKPSKAVDNFRRVILGLVE